MADNRTLGFDIVVNTQGSEKTITNLRQDINALRDAIEKVSKDSNVTVNVDGSVKNLSQLIAKLDETQRKLSQLESGYGKNIDKADKALGGNYGK